MLSYIMADGLLPYRNQAVEQLLLESVAQNQVILYLWRNERTVVIGRNQNATAECRIAALQADGGFLARRISGGGAVYHDASNLNFTFIAPKPLYNLTKQLTVIKRAVSEFGLIAELSGRNDITIGGRKFSGNAFYNTLSASLHHGTILIDTDCRAMERYLSAPADKLRSKGVKSVSSRVVNLSELSRDISVDTMANSLIKAFESEYGDKAQKKYVTEFNQQRLAELSDKFASYDWRLGREPHFEYQCGGRFGWGGAQLLLSVDYSVISACTLYSDCLDISLPDTLSQLLTGCEFSQNKISERLNKLPDYGADILKILEDSLWKNTI